MGMVLHFQDDFLDCYGDPEVIGKIGTDIQENKCSWLVIQALKKATPAQRKVLEVCACVLFHAHVLYVYKNVYITMFNLLTS